MDYVDLSIIFKLCVLAVNHYESTMKIKNAWICGVRDEEVIPVFGNIYISDGKIEKIERKSFKKYIRGNNKKTKNSYDAKGKVVTLPNVNFHEHIYSRLAKGLPIKGKTNNFKNILKNIWWKLDLSLDHEMIKTSAEMAALESLQNGVTYIFDHHSSPNHITKSLKSIANVLIKRGIRSVLAFETSDRNRKKNSLESMEENENSILEFETPDTKYLYGLHASFTLKDSTLKKVSEFINQNDVGIHIHLCEDPADRKISKRKFGSLPLSRLAKYNLLNDKSILSHAIHLTKNEYNKILKYNSAIAFNPDSNMNNSVGLNNFRNIPRELTILCGTDGMHANPAKSFKTLFLLMRHSGLSNKETFDRIIKTYFNQIKFVKKFFTDFPSLNKNDRAEFIIWDYVPPTPINKNNFWGHYIYGILESQVSSVIQNGEFLMIDKRLNGINKTKIRKDIYTQGKRLFKKFKSS